MIWLRAIVPRVFRVNGYPIRSVTRYKCHLGPCGVNIHPHVISCQELMIVAQHLIGVAIQNDKAEVNSIIITNTRFRQAREDALTIDSAKDRVTHWYAQAVSFEPATLTMNHMRCTKYRVNTAKRNEDRGSMKIKSVLEILIGQEQRTSRAQSAIDQIPGYRRAGISQV